ncbi:acyl carrier protein [Streptomyces lunalinharesii]|uniref:Carrier domain-containing protein n=1 Tax=Streptomyces lunalinharesii TaxID=333384 RepID=A0ABN3RX55_9ACTN
MTPPEKVESQVREIIASVLGSSAPSEIRLDDELHEIGVESLSILAIVVRVEEECGIKIGDSELFEASLKRVGDLVELVQSNMAHS